MITNKLLQSYNKIFKVVIDTGESEIILKPTQFGQFLFTQVFLERNNNEYFCLEGGGIKHNGCFNPDVRLEDVNYKGKDI